MTFRAGTREERHSTRAVFGDGRHGPDGAAARDKAGIMSGEEVLSRHWSGASRSNRKTELVLPSLSVNLEKSGPGYSARSLSRDLGR